MHNKDIKPIDGDQRDGNDTVQTSDGDCDES